MACTSNLFAQFKEVEEMWMHQLDTANKVNFTKPAYLKIDEKEILNLLDKQPSFGMYKDNYIISGVPTNDAINKYTADIKFQVSIRQRLTKSVLPFNTFLLLTYTQKSFWDIYKKSAPFEDNNYNPGLALVKPIIYKNQLRGAASFVLEHESNGKDSLDSRGWNYVVLSGVYFFNANWSLQAKLWAGFLDQGEPELDGGGNPDLFKYRGYGLVAVNYRSFNDKVRVSAIINPRSKFGDFNTQLELNLKLNSKANQYLFVQWYQGYAESLLEYNRFTSMVRVGICIKPPMRNFY
jgi:phospholipase A1